MSKNERLIRTLFAGFVFVGIGVATVEYDEAPPRPARSPASADCATTACFELIRLRKELLSKPGVDAAASPRAQLEADARETALLKEGGAILISIFRSRPASDVPREEMDEVVRFLVDTYDRDGAGIALDTLELGVGPSKAAGALDEIDLALKRLEPTLKPAAFRAFRLALAANRGEGESAPAKSGG